MGSPGGTTSTDDDVSGTTGTGTGDQGMGGDQGTGMGSPSGTSGTGTGTSGTAMGGGTSGAGMPSAPAAPAAPMTATAELKSVKDDSSMGTITFTKTDDGKVLIEGNFTGLGKKGPKAIYIHEKGDCSKKGANVGGHLNPTKAKHGPPSSGTRHAGDFGDLQVDESGNATFSMETDSITMDDVGRADTIINRSIVIHEKKDAKSGNAGKPLACGVIPATGTTGTTTP